MIRRQASDGFRLIEQDAHARLSGELAAHWGNERFAPLEPHREVILGVALHDSGWPLHDQSPTLNAAGLPIDVFESTRQIALPVWTASAERAEAADPYAGLLVSLHVLALSVYATTATTMRHEKFAQENAADVFALNRFQHQQIERQERLRERLGGFAHVRREYGLAEAGTNATEDRLRCNYRVLAALDLLSLAICCTAPPTDATGEVHARPGAEPIRLQLQRDDDDAVRVDPWPFAVDELCLQVPYRRVDARAWGDRAELGRAYAAAPVQWMPAIVRPMR